MLGQILFKIEIILNQLLAAQVGSIDVNKLEFENLVGLSIYDRQIGTIRESSDAVSLNP